MRYRKTTPTMYGGQIRKFREELGLDQWELGERVGLDSRQISMLENNKAPLPLELAIAMARVLHITLNELVGNDDENDESDTDN